MKRFLSTTKGKIIAAADNFARTAELIREYGVNLEYSKSKKVHLKSRAFLLDRLGFNRF